MDNIAAQNEKLANIFKSSISSGGEEEILRIASRYSRQITSKQIKILLYLEIRAQTLSEKNKQTLINFLHKWLELKEYNNSAGFVMKALENVSLRKFINENSTKINIEK